MYKKGDMPLPDMPENHNRINELLQQYVNRTISEDDLSELFEYISKEENKHILDAFMEKADKIGLPDLDVHNIDWEAMYQGIINDKKGISKFQFVITISKKIAIAASVLLIAYLGYRYSTINPTTPTAEKIVTHDFLPGSNRAVLKLENGEEIDLGNAKDGILVQQGRSEVIKSKEGFIKYNTLNTNGEKHEQINTLSTPRGGQYKLMLPDKSFVWLNAESSVTFPTAFTGKHRKVSITGEAYFEVVKNKAKPFVVEANGATIEVLGTHFNVNVYSNEHDAAVTLLEGSVKLNHHNNSKILKPGQQGIFKENSSIIMRNADTDNVVDWKDGLFIFEDASVPEVMRQIERWYDVDVKYIGKIPQIKFNGVISRNANVSKLLKLLQVAGKISFDIENRTIEVKQLNK